MTLKHIKKNINSNQNKYIFTVKNLEMITMMKLYTYV